MAPQFRKTNEQKTTEETHNTICDSKRRKDRGGGWGARGSADECMPILHWVASPVLHKWAVVAGIHILEPLSKRGEEVVLSDKPDAHLTTSVVYPMPQGGMILRIS